VKYFVTGGAGFIGSHFVKQLLGMPSNQVSAVVVLDKLTYSGNYENLRVIETDPRFQFVTGDICDSSHYSMHLEDCDLIVHFAAESHVDRSIGSATPFISTNVLGTQILLEAAFKAGVETFVHVSTDEVYGSIDVGSWTESEPLLPNSPYAASKASSDLVARSFHKTFGMDVRITRCSNNFGTHQFPEKLIPLFVTNLIEGLSVPLYGDGLNVRDWLHVEDHCSAIDLVARKGRPGEIYNIGGGTELTNLELTHLVLNKFGMGDEMIRPVDDRLGHDRRYSVDCTKIRNELGYEPRFPIAETLGQVIDWYRANEAWWRPLKAIS
jgi:dTDP-glucose 4,6-dehydratase